MPNVADLRYPARPMGDKQIRVDYRKWPDDPHWHFTVHELGADAYGRWFWLPAGARLQRGNEPPLIHPCTAAMLIVDGAWWSGFWNSDESEPVELYIDVIRPPEWIGDRVMMVDLDLDVARDWAGRVELLDRDEFELHSRTKDYPRELIDGAEQAAQQLLGRVRAREEPFGDVGERWLREALSRANP